MQMKNVDLNNNIDFARPSSTAEERLNLLNHRRDWSSLPTQCMKNVMRNTMPVVLLHGLSIQPEVWGGGGGRYGMG